MKAFALRESSSRVPARQPAGINITTDNWHASVHLQQLLAIDNDPNPGLPCCLVNLKLHCVKICYVVQSSRYLCSNPDLNQKLGWQSQTSSIHPFDQSKVPSCCKFQVGLLWQASYPSLQQNRFGRVHHCSHCMPSDHKPACCRLDKDDCCSLQSCAISSIRSTFYGYS